MTKNRSLGTPALPNMGQETPPPPAICPQLYVLIQPSSGQNPPYTVTVSSTKGIGEREEVTIHVAGSTEV